MAQARPQTAGPFGSPLEEGLPCSSPSGGRSAEGYHSSSWWSSSSGVFSSSSGPRVGSGWTTLPAYSCPRVRMPPSCCMAAMSSLSWLSGWPLPSRSSRSYHSTAASPVCEVPHYLAAASASKIRSSFGRSGRTTVVLVTPPLPPPLWRGACLAGGLRATSFPFLEVLAGPGLWKKPGPTVDGPARVADEGRAVGCGGTGVCPCGDLSRSARGGGGDRLPGGVRGAGRRGRSGGGVRAVLWRGGGEGAGERLEDPDEGSDSGGSSCDSVSSTSAGSTPR